VAPLAQVAKIVKEVVVLIAIQMCGGQHYPTACFWVQPFVGCPATGKLGRPLTYIVAALAY